MARINAYTKDGTINGSELLLGSDTDGSTKTFPISDLKEFLISQAISGELIYQFSNQAISGLGDGKFKADSLSFSSITRLNINRTYAGGTIVSEYLDSLLTEEVILYNIKDRNSFGRFTFGSTYTNNSVNDQFRDVTVTHVSSNGNLVENEFYAFSFEGKDKHYTHHQNNASTSWTINHNLNKFPSVSIKFSSSDEIYTNVGALAGVEYTDKNNLTINLVSSESGYAYLN